MSLRKRASGGARAKERASLSFFIFVIFFAVFGVIILTQILMLERVSPGGGALRAKFVDDVRVVAQAGRAVDTATYTPQASEPLDAHWQPVATNGTPLRFKFFVYSAYVERRTIPAIRIIAATKTRGSGQFWCKIFLADNTTLTVLARVKTIRENWNFKYSACFVLCPLWGTGATLGDLAGASVSVVPQKKDVPTNMLKVLDTIPEKDIENNLHVCVKPFHFSYYRALWLMEWIELNLLLGVSHFIMYEESLNATVRCLLDHYRRQGIVTLLPWKLDIASQVEIRNQGQFAAFNDCLFRSMTSAGWLLPLDVDEVVFPRRTRTLPTMLNIFRTSNPKKPPSALLFRNAFFYTRWEDDANALDSDLITMKKTRRWAVPHAAKIRSKYAVKPTEAVELGNHFVWEFAPGGSAYAAPPDRALLHHYRLQCEFGGDECLTVASVVDRTAHRWAKELEARVNKTFWEVTKICQIERSFIT